MHKKKKKILSKKRIKNLPETPGVYIFWNKEKKAIYIGKAINLKSRIRSYTSSTLSFKTSKIIKEIKYYSSVSVNSELEALLLEAHLVKKYKPTYNSALKDDKHPLYIKITKEKYPRVLTARKIDQSKLSSEKTLAFYGPFPSANNVRSVLKMIRRIFPYSDHKIGKRQCIYSQINLCVPCPSEIENESDNKLKKKLAKVYRENISLTNAVLSGKLALVERSLKKKMSTLSKEERFEEAIAIRNQIDKLKYITQPITPIKYFLKNPNLLEDIRSQELKALKKILSKNLQISGPLNRIECFDVAHLAGSKPTASMVTFINGEPDKSFYRHYRIRQEKGQDDIASLKEVIKRRVKKFDEWGKSDLIVVDGGKAQVSVFFDTLEEHNIPVIGLTKRTESLVFIKRTKELKVLKKIKVADEPALNLLKRLRDEAHRFARRYHHKLVQKSLFNT